MERQRDRERGREGRRREEVGGGRPIEPGTKGQ